MPEVFVGTVDDFADDARRGVMVDGREVFVFSRNNKFYAYENNCPHSGGPIGEGTIIGKVEAVLGPNQEFLGERFSEDEYNIVCPWHGYEFDVDTGRCAGDRRIRLRKFRAFEQEGKVYVSE